jgi:predicted lipase
LQDTLHKAVTKLLDKSDKDPDKYPVETISVTGHSLGAGLAVLSSFDLVKSGTSGAVPVRCYSFEGPRVGNIKFAEEYKALCRYVASKRFLLRSDKPTEQQSAGGRF